jgi:hypothetical protein
MRQSLSQHAQSFSIAIVAIPTNGIRIKTEQDDEWVKRG